MKITPTAPTPHPNHFHPIGIEIICETENELNALYAVFNHTNLCDFFDSQGIDHDMIRDTLEECQDAANHRSIKCSATHDALCVAIKNA